MKRSVFILLIVCSFCTVAFSQNLKTLTIKILPLREGPRPVPTLFICSEKSQLYESKFFNKIAVTDEPSLKAAMAFINAHPSAIKGLAKKGYPFGSFQISLYNKSEYMGGYVLASGTESTKYLQAFIDALTKSKADELLTDQLKSLLNRIK